MDRDTMTDADAAKAPVAESAGPKTLSVVVTNFNYERYLPTSIESLLSQSVPVQVIVVLRTAADAISGRLPDAPADNLTGGH